MKRLWVPESWGPGSIPFKQNVFMKQTLMFLVLKSQTQVVSLSVYGSYEKILLIITKYIHIDFFFFTSDVLTCSLLSSDLETEIRKTVIQNLQSAKHYLENRVLIFSLYKDLKHFNLNAAHSSRYSLTVRSNVSPGFPISSFYRSADPIFVQLARSQNFYLFLSSGIVRKKKNKLSLCLFRTAFWIQNIEIKINTLKTSKEF